MNLVAVQLPAAVARQAVELQLTAVAIRSVLTHLADVIQVADASYSETVVAATCSVDFAVGSAAVDHLATQVARLDVTLVAEPLATQVAQQLRLKHSQLWMQLQSLRLHHNQAFLMVQIATQLLIQVHSFSADSENSV
ncbi:MAG: hypothetical protein AAGA30_11880 [Planctomycetota bacterium]